MRILLLLNFILFNQIAICQEPITEDILKHKVKSIIISEKETKDEIKREYNQFGKMVKEESLVKRIPSMQLFITTLNVYDKNKLLYKIEFSNSFKDTTFYDYDSIGRLKYEFVKKSTYKYLNEYCYILGYNKNDIHYTPYVIRTYKPQAFYFLPNNFQIKYKNEEMFYLEKYRRGNYDSSYYSSEEYFFEILNSTEKNKNVDSFFNNKRTMIIKHSDSLTQEITLEITPSNYYKEGYPIYKNGREFSNNQRLKKSVLNYYSNKKLKHQSIKEFKDDNEVTYYEVEYRYAKGGLLIEKELDIINYYLSVNSNPYKNHSLYSYAYEYW